MTALGWQRQVGLGYKGLFPLGSRELLTERQDPQTKGGLWVKMGSVSPAQTGWLKIFTGGSVQMRNIAGPRPPSRLLELCHFSQCPLSSALLQDCKWNHFVYFLLLWGLHKGWVGEGETAGGAREPSKG